MRIPLIVFLSACVCLCASAVSFQSENAAFLHRELNITRASHTQMHRLTDLRHVPDGRNIGQTNRLENQNMFHRV